MGLLDFLKGKGAETIPSGSDVSSGTYRCTECGKEITSGSAKSLPPCPQCNNNSWEAVTGGDAADDPYPGR
jgi:Zn finger protein HypA/HybF involved in hydrogenase expression